MIDWEWYQDIVVFRVFVHLLLNANHKDKKWRGVRVMPGQRITSLAKLSKELGIKVQPIRTAINKLKSTGEITTKTTNKYTIITILNWNYYQIATSDITNEQQTTNKQLTTNKNDKKEKNVENRKISGKKALINYIIKEKKYIKNKLKFNRQDFELTATQEEIDEDYNSILESAHNAESEEEIRNTLNIFGV